MHNAQSILYIAAVSVSFFCLILTLLCQRHIREFPRYLIVFIALQTCGFIAQVLLHAPLAPAKHLWMFIAILHAYLVGPVIYLYALEVSGQEQVNVAHLGKLQIGLGVLGLIMASPILIMIHTGPSWEAGYSSSFPLFWNMYYAMAAVYVGVYIGLSFYYLYLVLQRMKQAGKRWTDLSVLYKGHVNESVKIQVLRVMTLGFALSIFINISRVYTCRVLGPIEAVSQLQAVGEILVTVCVLFVVITKMIQGGFVNQDNLNSNPIFKKYERSSLDKNNRMRIRHKLMQAMDDVAVYTDNSLTLSKLAQQLGEKHHYVSQVINQNLDSGFFELINKQRVELAKHMLTNDSNISIIDIAESVGFNSKATFYSAFAKFVKMTPAEFRKKNKP